MEIPMESLMLPKGGVLIIGAGIAGLYTALKLAPRPVTIVTAARLGRGSSSTWAQGGLAVAMGADDSPALHYADTVAAGAGLVDAGAAHVLTTEGPARVEDLIALGVPFDRDGNGQLMLGREAAHGRRRIVHVSGDQAGAAIMESLTKAALAAEHITILERHVAEDVLVNDQNRAAAVMAYNIDAQKRVMITAPQIVLATGGVGGLFAVTTNPVHAQGHGLTMAFRAGAQIMDPEFVQFHPTAMDLGLDPAPLATEALRGDGALLVDRNGKRLMQGVHKDMELAPRDIVARAVAAAINDGRGAFLDTSIAIGDQMATRFPTVYAALEKAKIDPAKDLIPIAPAAHYHMGGVRTNLSGATTRPGLWAVGEVAATGIHGANRLASNSLLEALVFGARCAEAITGSAEGEKVTGKLGSNMPTTCLPKPATSQELLPLRQMMSKHCGLLRDHDGLAKLIDYITENDSKDSTRSTGLENASMAAFLIAQAAIRRPESRGAHQRTDHTETKDRVIHTLLAYSPQEGLKHGALAVDAKEVAA